MKFNKINTLLCTALLGITMLVNTSLYASTNSNDYCDDPENIYVPEKPSKPEKPVKPEQSNITHIPYIKGYEDGTFRAERSVTREEIATMIARLLLDGKEPEENTSFEDISGTRYSNKYVGYLEKLGIVSGYEDGRFRPYEPVTRGEMASMIAKVQNLKGKSPQTYSDLNANHWAAKSIEAVSAAGYMNGYVLEESRVFQADKYLTRAEAVTSLNKVFSRDCSDAKITNMFSDLTSSHWAYQDILFAAIEHTHKN